MNQNLFRKYHNKLVRESILKACLCGLLIGCGALTVTVLLSWLFAFKAGLFLGLGLFAVLTAGSACLLYRFKFRPTTRAIAKRVDELGLEERLLTMVELENDDSYMAKLQREDAQRAMSRIDPILLKVAVSVSLIVAVAAVGICGAGMTAVGSLYYADAIPSGVELLEKKPAVHTFQRTYSVYRPYVNDETVYGRVVEYERYVELQTSKEEALKELFGAMSGDGETSAKDSLTYSIEEHGNAPAILALPAAGYTFVGWSDGVTTPLRTDFDVTYSCEVKAVFEPALNGIEPDLVMQNPQDDEDNDEDVPAPPSNTPQPPMPEKPNDKDHSRDESNQQINDGETYYGDELGGSREDASSRFDQDGNIPDNMKDLAGDYYDGIDKGSGGGSGSGESGGESGGN